MQQDLTKIYEGANLAGATNGVVFLPIVRAAALTAVKVATDEAQTGAAVFEVLRNGVIIAGLGMLTIANGAKSGMVAGLNVALEDSDEIVLNLLSGNVSAPVTLNLVVDDGQTGGAGGGDGNLWHLDAKPSGVISAKSDFFEGGSIDPKWTPFQAAYTSQSVKDGLLKFQNDGVSGNRDRVSGVLQPLPDDDTTIIVRIYNQSFLHTDSFSFIAIGLFEQGLTAPNTTKIEAFSLAKVGSEIKAEISRWTNFTTYGSFGGAAIVANDIDFVPFYYVKLRLTPGTGGVLWSMFYSRNGYVWTAAGGAVNIGYKPDSFGIICLNGTNQIRNYACQFIQYKNAADATLEGGLA